MFRNGFVILGEYFLREWSFGGFGSFWMFWNEHPEYINVGHAQKERSSEWEIGKTTNIFGNAKLMRVKVKCQGKEKTSVRFSHRYAWIVFFSIFTMPQKIPFTSRACASFRQWKRSERDRAGAGHRSRPAVGARFVECQQWHSGQGFELQPMDLPSPFLSVRFKRVFFIQKIRGWSLLQKKTNPGLFAYLQIGLLLDPWDFTQKNNFSEIFWRPAWAAITTDVCHFATMGFLGPKGGEVVRLVS